MGLRSFLGLLRDAGKEFFADKCPRLAAALSYYTLFAMAPLLIIIIAVAGLALGSADTRGAVVAQLEELMGRETAEGVDEVLSRANDRKDSTIAAAGSAVVLAFGASGVFVQLQDALNSAWGVQSAPRRMGLLRAVRQRFFSFAMVVALGFVLLVTLVVSAAWAAVADQLQQWEGPGFSVLFPLVDLALSLAIYTFIIASIYKAVPDAHVRWRHVWRGAALTAVLFTAGKFALGAYLANSDVGERFGPAAGIVVLLLWVYYSGIILFYGAEFTQVEADRAGEPLQPRRGAIAVATVPADRQGQPAAHPADEA